MGRRMRRPVFICGPVDQPGPQCGYVSYMDSQEYGPKGVPMHVHRNPDGTWRETVWGPESACREHASSKEGE